MNDNSLIIPSNPNMITLLEQYVKDLASDMDLQEKFPNILISLTEAVNNAIIHGNNSDERKLVHVKMKMRNKGLLFVVSDEGYGFNKLDICDPTCNTNIERLGGRGVFIMEKLCDKLSFYNNGSIVELYFKLS